MEIFRRITGSFASPTEVDQSRQFEQCKHARSAISSALSEYQTAKGDVSSVTKSVYVGNPESSCLKRLVSDLDDSGWRVTRQSLDVPVRRIVIDPFLGEICFHQSE